MSGKGSTPRPLSVPRDRYAEAFDMIFRKLPTCGQCGKVGDKCECAKKEGGRDE